MLGEKTLAFGFMDCCSLLFLPSEIFLSPAVPACSRLTCCAAVSCKDWWSGLCRESLGVVRLNKVAMSAIASGQLQRLLSELSSILSH